MRHRLWLGAAALALGLAPARAQNFNEEPLPPGADTLARFANVATYTMSFPLGDARQFVSSPSWFGISWELQWKIRRNLVVGPVLAMQAFSNQSNTTTDFPSGSATGEQARELSLVTALAASRWYPGGTRWRQGFLGLGAGFVYARQYYQLGVFDPISEGVFHVAVAPEAGTVIPFFPYVNGMIGLRYTVTAPAGGYIGGGNRTIQFLSILVSVVEH